MNSSATSTLLEIKSIPMRSVADRITPAAVRDVTQPSDRIHALDGLRGVAIGLVLLFHVRTLGVGHFAGRWTSLLEPIAARGQFGVEIFFVLSGFLITMLMLREERTRGNISLGRFYFRRAFRILPPAFVYLTFVAVLAISKVSTASGDLLTSAFFVRNFVAGGSSDTGHFWTLAIEEQFYLAWPLAMVLLPRAWRSIAVAVLVGLLAIFRHEFSRLFPNTVLTAFDFHYDGLLVGSLLALLRDSVAWRAVLDHRWIAGTFGLVSSVTAVAFLLSPVATRFGKYHELLVPGLLSIFVALGVNAVLPRFSLGRPSPIVRLLMSKPFVATGLVSYSLYLWQQPFCIKQSSLAIASPYCLFIALGAAVLSFFLIERPSLLLRRRCSVWFAEPATN